MPEFVDIAFDCLPLRLVGQLRPPLDASPHFYVRCERIADAIGRHGDQRAYWIENAHCTFRFANSDVIGMVRFEFDGVVTTDAGDAQTEVVELDVRLVAQTCGSVPAGVAAWLADQVRRALAVEFDRFIASGQHLPAGPSPAPDDPGL